MIEHWTRWLHSPEDDCRGALLILAQSAQTSLHAIIYALTMPDLAAVFIAKHQAGVTVGIVADHSQALGRTERPVMQALVDAGVPVIIASSPTGAILHDKVLGVNLLQPGSSEPQIHAPDALVAWGSFNFSGRGRGSGAQAQANTVEISNNASLCAWFWGHYEELVVVGQAHPRWQLRPARSGQRVVGC